MVSNKANRRIFKKMTHEPNTNPPNPARPQPIDWDFLLDNIREGKCLLVLGDEVFTNETGETAHTRLLKSLDLPNNQYVKRYYKGEDFFLFDQKQSRTLFTHQIKRFYKQEQPGELIALLADIPFHIYMTVTPDVLLPEVFKEKNFDSQHGFYKKNTDPQPIRTPTRENPLIYNLFGCIENEESLVLSHDDLYDYFKSIFARRSMPVELKDELRELRNIMFIGVPFDKWYLQILLREFELHNQSYAFTRFAANEILSDEVSTLCFEEFQIQFVDKKIDDFVRELHRRVAADPDIAFRKSAGPKANITDLVRKRIVAGDTESALEQLSDYCEGSVLQDEAFQLNGRFSRLKRRKVAGVLGSEEITLEENRINDDILDFVKKVASTL